MVHVWVCSKFVQVGPRSLKLSAEKQQGHCKIFSTETTITDQNEIHIFDIMYK